MVRRQQAADRVQRAKIRSPGRWGFARSVERRFWRQVAEGKRTAEAAVLARLKDWRILRQCRCKGDFLDRLLQIVAELHNLRQQLRVNS